MKLSNVVMEQEKVTQNYSVLLDIDVGNIILQPCSRILTNVVYYLLYCHHCPQPNNCGAKSIPMRYFTKGIMCIIWKFDVQVHTFFNL